MLNMFCIWGHLKIASLTCPAEGTDEYIFLFWWLKRQLSPADYYKLSINWFVYFFITQTWDSTGYCKFQVLVSYRIVLGKTARLASRETVQIICHLKSSHVVKFQTAADQSIKKTIPGLQIEQLLWFMALVILNYMTTSKVCSQISRWLLVSLKTAKSHNIDQLVTWPAGCWPAIDQSSLQQYIPSLGVLSCCEMNESWPFGDDRLWSSSFPNISMCGPQKPCGVKTNTTAGFRDRTSATDPFAGRLRQWHLKVTEGSALKECIAEV